MTADEPKLTMILEKVRPGRTPDCFKLWGCRGEGKGCRRNKHRARMVHCEDCVPADDEKETVQQFMARMARGDS